MSTVYSSGRIVSRTVMVDDAGARFDDATTRPIVRHVRPVPLDEVRALADRVGDAVRSIFWPLI